MRSGVAVAATVLVLGVPSAARAQAWTPPSGSGSVSVSFQAVDHTGHLLTDGSYIDNGRSRTAAGFVDFEYGLTHRFAVGVAIPYVWARYTDDDPPPPGIPFLPVDSCRCWHSSWQDFGFTARVKAIDTFDHVAVVTPLIAVGTPSHDYVYQGEAVVGRHLHEVRVGADASYRFNLLARPLLVNGRYLYSFVQEVIDVGTNRSNAVAAADYRLARNWSVGAFMTWQRTHGGLRAGAFGTSLPPPGEVNTPARVAEHDRLLRDNRTHVGAQASYRLRSADVFASYTYFATGTDSHAGHAFTAGLTLPFTLRK